MNKKKMTKWMIVVAISGGVILAFAQNNNSRPVEEGSCKDIFNSLQKKHGNDSIAFEILKRDFQFLKTGSVDRKSLLEKNYIEVIRYFNSNEGKACFCRSTAIRIQPDYPLLMDPSKLSSDKWLY